MFVLVGIYHVSLPAEYLSAFYFPFFFFFYIALFGVIFLYAGSLWFLFILELAPCGWVGLVACQVLLDREACISVLVGGAGSPLRGVQ